MKHHYDTTNRDNFCATKLNNLYVPTWLVFTGPVTHSIIFLNAAEILTYSDMYL